VFFRLRQLRPGQRVYVVRADRSVATFTITSIRFVAKDAFTSGAVYGAVPDAELRLITCGGQFDYATGSYLSNVIVYATLAPRPTAARPPAAR
jgi:sortase (surface protein transpeptidase)